MSNRLPIAEGLFTWPAKKPALLGSRCDRCGIASFPAARSCMACGSQEVTVEELPSRGTLWTWTVQQFMPKSPYNSGETPETFRPYGVGYLELPGGVRVEGRLTESDPRKLRVGMAMDVVFDTWRTEPNGDEIVSFFFQPVA
ncbi:MAG: OB-fold domain-containing protein [Pseudomonadales bacterium]|nr:OB-fold domain-containing protein [Pseudomonadales bacterium]